MIFDLEHFGILSEITRNPTHLVQGSVGHKPRSYAKKIGSVVELSQLPDDKLSRDQVRRFCENADNSAKTCFLVIMAWGAMRYNHGTKAWAASDSWQHILNSIRMNNISRSDCYTVMKNAHDSGLLPGMGPAYYTKLIYFLRGKPDGYIMDQWTSRSVNLLAGRSIVPLIRQKSQGKTTFSVDAKASTHCYEEFCETIDQLAIKLDLSGEQVEELLFSKGGKKSGDWRKYVICQSFGENKGKIFDGR